MMEHTLVNQHITSRQNFSKNIEDLNSVIKEFDLIDGIEDCTWQLPVYPLSDTNEMFAKIVLTISHIANEQMSDD